MVTGLMTRLQPRAAPREAGGLTLVELLIGLAMTSILLGALASLVTSTLALWQRSITVTEATDEAFAALDQITRDIRMAGYDPRQQDLTGLVAATPRRITLAADLDADGRIDQRSKELITYRQTPSGNLLRVVGRQAMPLLSGLTSDGLQFRFLDDQMEPIDPRHRDELDETRLISIALATRRGPDRAAARIVGGARLLNPRPLRRQFPVSEAPGPEGLGQ